MGKKKQPMKSWAVECTITGRCTVYVDAASEEEARAAVLRGDGQDELCEWEYDEIRSVSENV